MMTEHSPIKENGDSKKHQTDESSFGADFDFDTPSPLSFSTMPAKVAVVGKGMIKNNALLAPLLSADIQRWYPWTALTKRARPPEAFVGWGHKKSFHRAKKSANKLSLPALSVEDGFLRSLDSGISSRFGMSVVIDDLGIYFDLRKSSRLEQLIMDAQLQWTAAQEAQASAAMTKLLGNQLSKYNTALGCPNLNEMANPTPSSFISSIKLTLTSRPKTAIEHVLLIDQVPGDASIKGAGAGVHQFKQMLKVACQQHRQAIIWIKAHPASNKGYLSGLTLPNRVKVISDAVNPIALLRQVDHVYTVSSHMGFEALMLGKSVHCFGVSWYSGWGLTDDHHAPKKLMAQVLQRRHDYLAAYGNDGAEASFSVNQLFYAAYMAYSRYADPASAQPCQINEAMDWLVTNRDWQQELAGKLTVYEFSRWKIPFVKAFVGLPRTQLVIKPKRRLRNLLSLDHYRMDTDHPFLVWGLGKRLELQQYLDKKSVAQPTIYCMEDGFIRSNGLGATLLAPLSVVIDRQGIYYDATRPSDLETLLVTCLELSQAQEARVHQLWHQLLTQRVSKYNVGKSNASFRAVVEQARGKKRLLIVGQVEDDLSVQYCGSLIKTNAALIERVRQDYPDAYLIYKPHPDVEAGLRLGAVDQATLNLVDYVAYDAAMPDCLEAVDTVHTISSLTGFEALLRGLQVVCYGLPFYAGWGLTQDIDAHLPPKASYIARRNRQHPLTLEQLIHAALIRYPLYRLPNGYGLAQPEQVIDYLYPTAPSPRWHHTARYQAKLDESEQQAFDPQNVNKRAQSLVTMSQERAIALKQKLKTRLMQLRHRLK